MFKIHVMIHLLSFKWIFDYLLQTNNIKNNVNSNLYTF